MILSQDTIAQIQNRVEIEEVVADFVTLKRKGQNLWACCPFHNEKSPSFSVSPSKGIYKCFGCGKAGDAIQFIIDLEGLSYVEAMGYLAKKYGIEIKEEEQTDEALQQQHAKDSLIIALNYAKDYYKKILWEHEEGQAIGLSYFKERGFTDEVIQEFDLGYSLDIWDGFTSAALQAGYSEEILIKAGLTIAKADQAGDITGKYDRFRGRVIFPIHNITGKAIAFGARILKADKKQPKYVNSPETEVYHKSNVLYGIFQGRTAIRQTDNCFLVEGYTDVISMHLAGVANVVSSSGTSLTEEQIRIIGRYTKNITVLFDGDAAGLKASLRGIDMILEGGLNVLAVVFPEGEDPDSYARKLGNSGFQTFLKNNTQDFITFKTNLFAKESALSPAKKAESIREIILSISKIPDAIKRTFYVKQTSEELDIDQQLILSEINRILLERSRGQSRSGVVDEDKLLQDAIKESKSAERTSTDSIISIHEKECIRLLLQYGSVTNEEGVHFYESILAELGDIALITPVYAEVLAMFHQKLAEGVILDDDYLLRNGKDYIKKEVIDMISRYSLSLKWEEKYKIYVPKEAENIQEAIVKNMLHLKYYKVSKMLEDNSAELRKCEDIDDQIALLKMHLELEKSKREFGNQLGIVVNRKAAG